MDRKVEARDENRDSPGSSVAARLTRLAAAAVIASAGWAHAEIADRIVANVNGAIILLSEVRDQQAALADLRERQGLDISAEELTENRVLSSMIDEKLAASYAREKEIDVKESEVDKAVLNIQERNQVSGEDFKKLLLAQGSTMEKFRERLKNQLLVQKAVSMEVDMVSPTEEEAKAFYQENRDLFIGSGRVKASHILILAAEDAPQAEDKAAAGKIAEIKKAIDEGADFAEMAKKHSADPSGQAGGGLGWIKRGEVVPAFEKAAFAMEPGQVSGPVRTQFGYHLILITEKEKAEPAPFGKVADQIKDRLAQIAYEKKRKAWLASIREQAYIEILY